MSDVIVAIVLYNRPNIFHVNTAQEVQHIISVTLNLMIQELNFEELDLIFLFLGMVQILFGATAVYLRSKLKHITIRLTEVPFVCAGKFASWKIWSQ